MELRDVIRIRRKELGLSLEQIGSACGVGKSIVAKWERGEVVNIKRDNLAALADVLQVSPLVLMGREELGEQEKTAADDGDGLKFALFGGDADKISDEALEEVLSFARYVKQKELGK